jgi:hypothetical protein
MAKRVIDYGKAVEQALRTVVRDVLRRVARDGLLGPHHFFITFKTEAPGVDIAPWLKERYPDEMTIVIQHQYWDLEVDEAGFAVTLSFNNVSDRLRIPFEAVKVFYDPGAEFVLQFTLEPETAERSGAGEVVALPTADERPPAPVVALPMADPAGDDPPPAAGSKGAEIVTLDRFRKK